MSNTTALGTRPLYGQRRCARVDGQAPVRGIARWSAATASPAGGAGGSDLRRGAIDTTHRTFADGVAVEGTAGKTHGADVVDRKRIR
jgi:hypothetical protein